jgi:hypothetical protein
MKLSKSLTVGHLGIILKIAARDKISLVVLPFQA